MNPVLSLAACLVSLSSVAMAEPVSTSAGPMTITPVVDGLEEPWGLAFLPDGSFLVTERDGRLIRFAGEDRVAVEGLPEVLAGRAGRASGCPDPRRFRHQPRGLAQLLRRCRRGWGDGGRRGKLSEDGTRLEGFETLFVGNGFPGGRHFGSRLVELPDGLIALATGDRGTGPEGMQAQDPQNSAGKVILLARDGSPGITQDGWLPGAFSLGHRNIQGAALDLSGRLLTVEHGAQGGDELNAPEAGRTMAGRSSAMARTTGAARSARGPSGLGWSSRCMSGTPRLRPRGWWSIPAP